MSSGAFAAIARLSSLRTLFVSYSEKFSDAAFNRLRQCATLRDLSVSSCTQFTNAGLVDLSHMAQLTSLTLNRCPPSLSAAAFSHLPTMLQLRSLDLSGCSQLSLGDLVFEHHPRASLHPMVLALA
jgi:hypothetical protein